jgi:enoyl-CoA hydratase/carnithine racemase
LTLARPDKRNAQNPLMWQELTRLGTQLLADETLRCLVVTGEGPLFSAGIDLVEGIGGLLAGWSDGPLDEDSLAAGLAARLAAQPPLAVRGARRAIEAAWHSAPEEGFRLAVEEQLRCLRSDDFKEARQAMNEGRDPQWRGR